MKGTDSLARALGCVMCLAAALSVACEKPPSEDEEAIRGALRQLDQANEDCDGAAAVAVMSSRGLAEYDRLVKLALDGTKAEVQSLSPGEMSQVIELRHRLTRAQLEKMDGKAYQEYATSECWYSGMGSDWEGSIGEVYVSGDTAYAEVLDENGRKSGVQGHFEREDGVWKVNEFSFHRVWDEELTKLAAENNVTIPEMVVLFEEWDTGKKIRKSIWEPMR